MRTALLETSAAKSMRVKGKNNILLLPKFVLFTMSHESEHSESEFFQNYFSRQLSPKAKKEIYTPRKWRSSQLSQKPTSKQAVKETTFPDKLSNN